MKQLGLIIVVVLPLFVAAEALQNFDPALLKRVVVRQSAVKSSDLESAVDESLQRWLDIPEVTSGEGLQLNRVDESESFSTIDNAVFTTSTALRKRTESDQEETKTPKSTLSPHAPVFVPQSAQTSPRQPETESVSSPQEPSQPDALATPSRSSPASTSPQWTPEQQALLNHVKAYSESQAALRQSPSRQSPPRQSPPRQSPSGQSPSDHVNPASPARRLKLSPSQQALVGYINQLAPYRLPTMTHPQPDPAFRDPGPSRDHYWHGQSPYRNQPSTFPSSRQDSRFFPGGVPNFQPPDQKLPQTPRSPVQASRDPLFDRSGPRLTVKVPPRPPETHPELSPPSIPSPRTLSHQTPFHMSAHGAPYPGMSLDSIPAPNPLYRLDVPPPWRQQDQHSQSGEPPARAPLNAPPSPRDLPRSPPRRPIPPAGSLPRGPPYPRQASSSPHPIPQARPPPPGWPQPIYIVGPFPQGPPHPIYLGASPLQDPSHPMHFPSPPPQSSPHWPNPRGPSPQSLPRARPSAGPSPSTTFRPALQARPSQPNPPRPFRQTGFRPQNTPPQLRPIGNSPSDFPRPAASPARDRPRLPPAVVVTPLNPQDKKNGHGKS